jgi:hypothetical protein
METTNGLFNSRLLHIPPRHSSIHPLPTRIHPIPPSYPPSTAATTQSTTSTPTPNEQGPGHKQSNSHTDPSEPCLTPCSRCSRSSSTLARYRHNYTRSCRRFCTTSPSVLARVGVGLVRCRSSSPWGRKSCNLTACFFGLDRLR